MSELDALLIAAGRLGLRRHGGREGVGKRIGGRTYVHRQYADLVIPEAFICRAERLAGAAARGWTCAKYGDDGVITLQHCPEFDRVHEPAVGVCITVTPRGEVTERLPNEDPLIWHHKWMWVRDSYRGFDVAASVRRSLQWAGIVPAKLKSVIGQRSVWQQVCRELGLRA